MGGDFERQIALVQFDPGPPPGWDVTLECGHSVWFADWPQSPFIPCARCMSDAIELPPVAS
jgi:hypothetical protein